MTNDTGQRDEEKRGGAGARPSPAQRLWRERGHVLRAWLTFVVSAALLVQLLIWARPFTDSTLARWIAKLASATLNLLGFESQARGTFVISSLGTLEIIRECTGVYPMALFIAAVIAHRCTIGRKLAGIVLGILGVQAINLVRVVSLFFVYKWYPESFETAHLVVWQTLVVFLTLLLWLVWSSELAGAVRRDAT